MKKYFFPALLILFFLHFIFRAATFSKGYFVRFDSKYWEMRYNTSQWVVPNSKNSIGDDGLYAYAGYKYVFEGMNPILNSAEVPPLGKYLIGITILIFQNQNIFGLLTGISALILFYIFNLNLFKNRTLAFLPVFIFSFDMLFWEQLQANYLDLLYLSFLFLVLHFSLSRKYIFASIALGCFAATKFPPTSLLVAACMVCYTFIYVKKDLVRLLLSLILWPFVFALSFFRFFMLGNGLVAFAKVLKYFLNYYTTGAKSENHLMVFEMLLIGRWPTWWDGVKQVSEWTILWPLSFIGSLSSVGLVKKVKKGPMMLVVFWVIAYFLFLLVVPVAPRYLLLFIPFLYNIAIWVLSDVIDLKFLRRSR